MSTATGTAIKSEPPTNIFVDLAEQRLAPNQPDLFRDRLLLNRDVTVAFWGAYTRNYAQLDKARNALPDNSDDQARVLVWIAYVDATRESIGNALASQLGGDTARAAELIVRQNCVENISGYEQKALSALSNDRSTMDYINTMIGTLFAAKVTQVSEVVRQGVEVTKHFFERAFAGVFDGDNLPQKAPTTEAQASTSIGLSLGYAMDFVSAQIESARALLENSEFVRRGGAIVARIKEALERMERQAAEANTMLQDMALSRQKKEKARQYQFGV